MDSKMNQQIQALAEQAQILITTAGAFSSQGAYQLKGEHLAKFAELIVRECAGVTLDYKNGDHYAGWCDHAKEILKHFGVEE